MHKFCACFLSCLLPCLPVCLLTCVLACLLVCFLACLPNIQLSIVSCICYLQPFTPFQIFEFLNLPQQFCCYICDGFTSCLVVAGVWKAKINCQNLHTTHHNTTQGCPWQYHNNHNISKDFYSKDNQQGRGQPLPSSQSRKPEYVALPKRCC